MSARFAKIVLCIGIVTAASALGITKQSTTLKLKVKVVDKNGHSINHLNQHDFNLKVDNTESEISWWRKEQDLFHHSTYTLGFNATRTVPMKRHQVAIRVRIESAELRYLPTLDY